MSKIVIIRVNIHFGDGTKASFKFWGRVISFDKRQDRIVAERIMLYVTPPGFAEEGS